MSLPFTLPPGIVAVYGEGYWGVTPLGVTIPENFRMGTVYNIWDGGIAYVYQGTVMWKEGSQYARIVTNENLTYTLLYGAQLATEQPPP